MNLTKHGNNANIKVHILDDGKMIDAGFRVVMYKHKDPDLAFYDHKWYMCKSVNGNPNDFEDITFNMTIYSEDDWKIDILDEAFCQPYDYQRLLTLINVPHMAYKVKNEVDRIMSQLKDFGIISGWEVGDYI